MKKSIYLLFFSVLFLNFQCEKNSNPNPPISSVSKQVLDQKKQTILNYINSFTCNGTSGCSSIAFGSKPCGGPWEYLLFPNTVDLPTLTAMVTEYNELENQFNIETNAVSDCMLVQPPSSVSCNAQNGCVSQ